MNKQELIDKLKRRLTVMSTVEGSDYDKGYKHATKQHLAMIAELDEPVRPPEPKPLEPEKPVVPQFIADYIDSEQKSCSTLSEVLGNMYYEQRITDWFYVNSETFAKALLYGYEIEKEKLYRAKNKQTGEYLCYCFEFFHDKNSSSEDQRFTAEEKRWKELGYWGNDLYVFEEAEGEDE